MTTILITGANRGIGFEFVKQYRHEGADIIACCRNPEGAEKLKSLGVRLEQLDVADSASIEALSERLKGQAVDILICNAGIYGPERQDADDAEFDSFLETFRVNSVGPVVVARALKINLMAGQDKKLVFITSKMGSVSDSTGGFLAYRGSKAALNMFAHAIALEWKKHGIKVGLFNPGWVKTDMGGPSAPLAVTDSVAELKDRIAEMWPGSSGKFLDYRGDEIAW